jgi:hypothetical protein
MAKVWVPLLIGAGFLYVGLAARTRWHRFEILALAFAAAVYLAIVLRGRVRDTLAIVASVVFCLAAAEIYCVDKFVPTIEINTPGHSGPHPILGWAPKNPGVAHAKKLDISSGRVIWDVDYTLDAQARRQVISRGDGPAVVFAGGSDTFGSGVTDADTLPQAFADAIGRRLRVVNLGVPGYGPQQLLRGLETGLFDDALKNARLLVIETTPWQATRTGCILDYMAVAPHYEIVGGEPKFLGPCKDSWSMLWRVATAVSSIPQFFIARASQHPGSETIDLYVAIILRAATLARERYGVPTVVLYQPDNGYLGPSGYTDEQLMKRFRDGGLGAVDAGLNPADFPGQDLTIPGEGHPTGVANRAWAVRLHEFFDTAIAPAR